MISKFLHFADEDGPVTEPTKATKLHKILPVLNHLNQRFKDTYNPTKVLNIGEFALTSDRSRCKEPGYEHSGSLKFVSLHDETGYVLNTTIHEGKRQLDPYTQTMIKADPEQITLQLVEPFLNKGHQLYVNDVSVSLAKNLIANNTGICD